MDGNILLWIQENLRSEAFDPVMTFITSLGDAGFIWIAIGLMLVISRKYRGAGVSVWLALLSEYILVDLVIKPIVCRTRPFHAVEMLVAIIEHPKSFSFPSGHSGSSFAAAVVLFLCLPRRYGLPALIFAFLIAFSRLYVGVHYPTDVLAGACIGALVGFIVYKAFYLKMLRKGSGN